MLLNICAQTTRAMKHTQTCAHTCTHARTHARTHIHTHIHKHSFCLSRFLLSLTISYTRTHGFCGGRGCNLFVRCVALFPSSSPPPSPPISSSTSTTKLCPNLRKGHFPPPPTLLLPPLGFGGVPIQWLRAVDLGADKRARQKDTE